MTHLIDVQASRETDEGSSSITRESVTAIAEKDAATGMLMPKQIGTAEVSPAAVGKGVTIKTPDGFAKFTLDDSGGLLIDMTGGLAFTIQSGQTKIVSNGVSLILTGNPVVVNGKEFPAQ